MMGQSPPPRPPDAAQSPSESSTSSPQRAWYALVLKTFQGDRDGAASEVWRSQLATLVPPIAPQLGITTNRRGSMVLYGQYSGWEDPQIAEDLKLLEGFRVNNKKIFGTIIKTVVYPPRDLKSLHPHELLSIRAKYPNERILYTLEIGVWGEFDSNTLTPEDCRANAEIEVARLRAINVPAFFHHDPISNLSTITIGVFPETAIDSASGLLSTEAERWQKRFPLRMTNGEPLSLPVSGRPDLGMVPQPTRLVLIPDWDW